MSITTVVVAVSVFSCFCSACVIFTIMFFPQMRRGPFHQVIMYMSVADLGMNITSSFGFPANGSVLCWVQGSVQNFFAISGWFWTTLLAYRVYTLITHTRTKTSDSDNPPMGTSIMGISGIIPLLPALPIPNAHLIGWGLPALLSALPLITNNYGSPDNSKQWCQMVRRGQNPIWLTVFWSYASFFAWLFICILLMLVWMVRIWQKYRHSMMKDVIRKTYDRLYLYPLVMCLCWGLNFACVEVTPNPSDEMVAFSMICGISDGIITSLIFAIKSEEAQKRWTNYFFPSRRGRPSEGGDNMCEVRTSGTGTSSGPGMLMEAGAESLSVPSLSLSPPTGLRASGLRVERASGDADFDDDIVPDFEDNYESFFDLSPAPSHSPQPPQTPLPPFDMDRDWDADSEQGGSISNPML
ncbi:hypothetical protein B484DRAFT_443427 [Ochromonadaceae sp. CCMP2298]|nr:hypothetical protein B484DRAFT_443427 [Ochromonadaceae sp. CCMP2298]|mmetsp:Transcript_23578/g.52372  ORF Transcript_23578/g.52372 Transcript_23578/m.52372 type:complete len:411 (-) Transcript_23578:175-1407(-)